MPFWKRSSPEDQQRLIQDQQEAEASQRSLESGGLPTKAIRRLQEETAAGHPLFSSDLSTNEFLLTRNAGYVALSQVMGSSIYQMGWQYTRSYSSYSNLYELTTLSNAHQHAAQLALGRLEQEASLLKAHGIIGVRLNVREYEWGANLMEYTAIGTAIRLQNVSPPAHPFLSDLSGQEFWTLLSAGYYPVGLVTGYCSYAVSSGWDLNQRLRSWYNQEIGEYTQAVYDARGLAMSRAENMARSLRAVGIVGVHIGYYKQMYEYESEPTHTTYRDLYVHFSVVGTAITAQRKDHIIPPPKPTLTFTDLRPGSRGETRELTIRG
jgi:uncharacterized protein YbjQ (UPF0145 family)